jgi:hypothetical protein
VCMRASACVYVCIGLAHENVLTYLCRVQLPQRSSSAISVLGTDASCLQHSLMEDELVGNCEQLNDTTTHTTVRHPAHYDTPSALHCLFKAEIEQVVQVIQEY